MEWWEMGSRLFERRSYRHLDHESGVEEVVQVRSEEIESEVCVLSEDVSCEVVVLVLAVEKHQIDKRLGGEWPAQYTDQRRDGARAGTGGAALEGVRRRRERGGVRRIGVGWGGVGYYTYGLEMRKLSFLKPAAGSDSMCIKAVLCRDTGSSSSSDRGGMSDSASCAAS